MKHDQQRLAPLLRAIDREIAERTRSLARIEHMLGALRGTHAAHGDDMTQLISARSLERRELYRIEKELSRLGILFDAENPRGILVSAQSTDDSESLSDTKFHSTRLES